MSQAPKHALTVEAAMAETLQRIRPYGFVAAALIRPDPLRSDGTIGRKLEIASVQTVVGQAEALEAGLAGHVELITPVQLEPTDQPWSSAFQAVGFRSLLIVRIPVVSSHCFEFVLFSSSGYSNDESINGAAAEIMRAWPMWRATLSQYVCPLTAREREALLAVAGGFTGAEASEGIGVTTRTFRLHVINARKKLFAANGPDATHRAHLLCAF